MKKILLALLASTAVGGAALAQDFPDVPAGSYAEEAVARLADLGIVIGFPDGTFRGNEAFTRYQAALVVTRLLDVVEGEMLTDADLDTVRNALQELASDVAANEQAVSDLQTAIDSAGGADAEAVEQLQAQLDALTVELDTLTAAQEAAAGLEQQVLANTDQIDQLTDLIGILNEDLAAIGTGGEVDTSFLEDIEQNTSDVANLREFVVLLRRDQVGLTERVATIEESDAAQTARLNDLETRVTALEESQVAFGGSIGLIYTVGRLSGDEVPFDVDRIFGVGLEREQPVTVFSGDFQSATDDLNDDDDEEDAGEVAEDRQDIEFSKGSFAPELTLDVNFSAERGLAPETGLNTFESTVALELTEATVLDGGVDVADPEFDLADPDNYFDAYVFEFTSVTATLGPIGADPINFFFGEEPEAEFSEYVFESLGPGFRADVGTPDFLAFLQPTLQIAYGVYQDNGDEDDNTLELPSDDADLLALEGEPVANPFTDAYYRGIRGTLTPFSFTGEEAAETLDEAGDEAAEATDAAATTDDNVEEGLVEDTVEEAGAAADEAGAAVDAAADAGAGFFASTGGFSATGGFSIAQISGFAAENADAADVIEGDGVGPNADITVYGLDGQINLSILNVTFEYAQNDIGEGVYFQSGDDVLEGPVAGEEDDVPVDFDGAPVEEGDEIPVATTAESSAVTYAELTVDTEAAGIPLLRSLEANYRDIPEFWYGLKYDDDTYPWNLDQTGYGAEATIGVSIFELTGFVDTYSVADGNPTEDAIGTNGATVVGDEVFAYGVRLGVEVFRAVEVFGFYTVATLDGTQVFDLDGPDGNAERNGDYTPGIGVGVEHDGEAENALVPGLNFSAAYSITQQNFTAANLDAEFTLGAFTLSPYVDYSVEESPVVGDDDVVALTAGTGIVTEPLDIILQPSFAANVNYRNAVHTDVADIPGGTYTANVLQYSVGVNFNRFLFENSTFGVRYGSFSGENIEVNPNVNGADDFASDISDGDQANTGTQTTNGYEVVWNY